ncbi:hypothetical protein [Bradyrhizobium japonicum]|uniref:hypothetical protein n=1 Tax=Bradyrhizobium japonicum TaxID=375 RepID=UPI00209DD5E5|nr:hypothetical protein [Bradyrhizobium japonicum]MCP1761970.1 putative AAA+ superfamily ATPase [Bradyrhizobium japonicum]MCP1793550.1 putative AAA+ superfamily ATPase [Bradyrhizobium japonicum]MCP1805983.1 putative AAA+ superfamily ATPase [Bradyrhizobium japonicum]MCP1812386.1 putative AAA+ superfamily ATPase [Bradyrhizobium japonicum]MCP1873571.1 putative AAA+ superfamily ATPase [Bradyrhizobium japonicum]
MPTLGVDFDFSQIEQRALALGATADQMPYIMATTLNMAAENTRSYLIETTWPSSVTVRNRSFMNAALTTKGSRATKGDLTVEIYDKIGRANLFLHAKGGTRRAKGGNLSIPSSVNVQRTSGGAVRTQQQPKNLRNSFKRGRFIFQRQGKSSRKRSGRIKLMYSLRPSVPIRQDVPFYKDFAEVMRQEMTLNLAIAVIRAMSTRRR